MTRLSDGKFSAMLRRWLFAVYCLLFVWARIEICVSGIRSSESKNRAFSKIRSPRSSKPNQIQSRDVSSWRPTVVDMQKNRERQSDWSNWSKISNSDRNLSADELQCVHFSVCSGCSVASNFRQSPIMDRAKSFFASLNHQLPIHIGNIHGWRTHIKLAAQPTSKWGGIKFGLYAKDSHVVVPIPQCRVHHPALNDAVEFIRIAALRAKVRGYTSPVLLKGKSSGYGSKPLSSGTVFSADDSRRGVGDLRYIQLSLERSTGLVQVVLVWNSDSYAPVAQTLTRFVNELRQIAPSLWHSISVNFNTQNGNAILDLAASQWRLLWGHPYVTERIGNTTFAFRPAVFRQANLEVFGESLLPFVLRHIPLGSRVTELYSGVGLLGVHAAQRAVDVACSDISPFVQARDVQRSVQKLQQHVASSSFRTLQGALQQAKAATGEREPRNVAGSSIGSVSYTKMDAESALLAGECDYCDVLLVDPPRQGLHEVVRQFLLDEHVDKKLPDTLQRVIYVSCGFDALERDCR